MKKEEEIQWFTEKINSLRDTIKRLEHEKKIIIGEIDVVKEELQKLESKTQEDPLSISDTLYKDIKNIEKEKKQLEIKKYTIDKKLYGTVGSNKVGLIWEHDNCVIKLRKLKVPNQELLERVLKENTDKYFKKIKSFIKQILTESDSKKNILKNELDHLTFIVLIDHNLDGEISTNTRTDEQIKRVIRKRLVAKGYIELNEEEKGTKTISYYCEKYIREKGIDLLSIDISKLANIIMNIASDEGDIFKKNSIRVFLQGLKNK